MLLEGEPIEMRYPNRTHSFRQNKPRFTTLATLFFWLLSLSVGAAAQVMDNDIKDALLERISPTEEMNVNRDGVVDVGDLRSQVTEPVFASFAEATSIVSEASGLVLIGLTFSDYYAGDLLYSVTGTASNGQDYSDMSGVVQIAGSSGYIPIELKDDANQENAETIIITLVESQYCVPSLKPEHTVMIEDNDADWYGSIQTNGASLHFTMRILQSEVENTAAIISAGEGIIPNNSQVGEWSASVIKITNNSFEVTVTDMLIANESTLTEQSFIRTLEFEAYAENENDRVILSSEISGTLKEYLTCTQQPQFNRSEIQGRFTLLKNIPNIEPQIPELEDLQ